MRALSQKQAKYPGPVLDIYELARQLGGEPIEFEDMPGTPWTDEEGGTEDFDAWLREIRSQGDRVRDFGD